MSSSLSPLVESLPPVLQPDMPSIEHIERELADDDMSKGALKAQPHIEDEHLNAKQEAIGR